jgi:predicted DNA-binding protein (UPF0251 family)
MVRPRRCRRVGFEPNVTYFKPAGIRMIDLEESILTVDEFEAVRLKDLEGLEQEDAAKKMNISQPTFHRLLLSARKNIADAIVNGKAIKIEGGVYKMVGLGRGRGRQSEGFDLGPGGECVCPKCGKIVTHTRGTPCFEIMCPDCKTPMTRKG